MTHALHFLPHVDYIYAVTNGRITERGTYTELMANNGEFSKFIAEFGSREETEEEEEAGDGNDEKKNDSATKFTAGAGIMQAEERNIGAVSAGVYRAYLSAGKGLVVVPLLVASVVLLQGATVMWSYWFVSLPLYSTSTHLVHFVGLCTGRKCRPFLYLI